MTVRLSPPIVGSGEDKPRPVCAAAPPTRSSNEIVGGQHGGRWSGETLAVRSAAVDVRALTLAAGEGPHVLGETYVKPKPLPRVSSSQDAG